MALQGTIKDFALPDIFQLIGLQKKTGILTLSNDEDTVTLKFRVGEVVGADNPARTLEDRLGEVLVRTGTISQRQLEEALKAQETTLQRLGHILVNSGLISEDELIEALAIQSHQIIYRLFRWMDGEYKFDAVEDLDYDQKHFIPVSAETILMEGARMIDEWPIIERRIKSPKMVLRTTEAAADLDLGLEDSESQLEEELEFDLGFEGDQQAEPDPDESSDDDGVKLSREERQILSLVDGKRTVGEICDLLALGEFDVYRMLADLMTRALIEEVPREQLHVAKSKEGRVVGKAGALLVQVILAAGVLFAAAMLHSNSVTPWKLLAAQPATEQFRHFVSMTRLETISGAIQVFYLDAGMLPGNLADLTQNEYLRPGDLLDPWGRPYSFELSAGGYRVFGLDGAGEPDSDLTVSRTLSETQRLMLADETPGG